MASHEPDKEEMENRDEIVSIELPAPKGWKKKFTPKKGGTPRRNEIVFISPTDEEIKNKRQLDQFLKSHPGGPSASEFDWGTGDTPRRSARIKSKATESPESEPPKKVQKSSSKKGAKEKKDDIDGEGETTEEKGAAATAAEETKESAEVETKDAEDAGDHSKGEVTTDEALADKDTVKDTDQKIEEKIDEMSTEKQENQEATNKTTSDAKEKEAGNNSLPTPGPEECKEEADKKGAEPEAPSPIPVPNETASSEQDTVVKDAVPAEADAKVEKESEEAKVGQEDTHDKETSTEKVADAGEVKPDSDSLKEGQEVAKPMENHSVSCEEAQHEPKASQVSC